jgi:hypothetical protein
MNTLLDLVTQAHDHYNRKQPEDAVALAETALRISPDCGPAHQILGLVLSDRGQLTEAIDRLQTAIRLQPDLASSYNGLGLCYLYLGQLDEALFHLERALFLQPDHPNAHFNRAMAWLKLGRYDEGWTEYEWRWLTGQIRKIDLPRTRWLGTPLEGRSILVCTEQGIGDALQFIRFLPELKSLGARVSLSVIQQSLHPLIRAQPFFDEWIPLNEQMPINFDYHVPLLSIPGVLRIEEPTIPRSVPYIAPDPQRVERWRSRIHELPGFKIGLAWQGNPSFPYDRYRSIPLAQFEPLARIPGLTFVSLQRGPGEEQIEPNRHRVPVHVLPDLDTDAPFLDTAAVLQHLDLVIAFDSSLAHLAGALCRPVWVLLWTGCDWRWLHNRSDSPWYPSARLFRQHTFGDWDSVIDEVAAALAQRVTPV